MASILRINDEKTYQLIELYRKEECLWNTKTEQYKMKWIRNEAAESIAKKLNIKHFTSRHVIMKFRNLRNSYCQELKKIAASVKSGEEPVYRPKVFWFALMDSFLRPHLHLDVSTEPILASKTQEIRKTEQEDEEDENEFFVDSHSEGDGEDSKGFEPEAKRFRNSSMDKNPFVDTVIQESSLSSWMQNISTQLQNMSKGNRDDCFDSFGKYVAAMLRTMPTNKALELQPKIVALLVSGALKNEDFVTQSDD